MSGAFALDWLAPAVDRCRTLIAERSTIERWDKPSPGGGAEPVTNVDVDVERLLIDAIHARIPKAAIVSEESHPEPSALRAETCFVIDPIDGTEEFLAGRRGYAISVAAFHHQRPVAGLLDLPAHDQRFQATADGDVRLNGEPVQLSPITDLGHARLAISATQHRAESLRPFWERLTAAGTRVAPTPAFAAKLAAVLCGECDAALYLPVRPRRTAIWDYAAPAFLLATAGGWFGAPDGTDLLKAQPFTYRGGWVAAPPRLRDPLLRTARRAPVAG